MTTGTSVVAIKYKDGVIIAADTLGSYGSMARFQELPRIFELQKRTMISTTGDYADYQAMLKMLEERITQDELAGLEGAKLSAKEVHQYLRAIMYNKRNQMKPLQNIAVIAGVLEDGKPYLGYVDMIGTSFEENVISTGLGGYMANPILRKCWNENLTREAAMEAVKQAMLVLFYRDARTINRIQFADVTKDGVVISEPTALPVVWDRKAFLNIRGEVDHVTLVDASNDGPVRH